MLVHLSVDIEGIAGVVHTDQARRSGHDYALARQWMTREANAAVLGAFDGGASGVVIVDAHGDMRNLLLDELDPRVEVVSGSLKPMSMVHGVSSRFGVALFVGYHAGAGSRNGILDHTYSSKVIARCRIGDRDFDETALNAMVCGEQGVPVGLVTGDSTVCARAEETLGDVETVVVKEAVSRHAARSVMPSVACERVQEGARRAVKGAIDRRFRPFLPPPPHRLELDFH
ncbi:MAG: M55 family metallopeptidase, partial [Polyangiales bacterium]